MGLYCGIDLHATNGYLVVLALTHCQEKIVEETLHSWLEPRGRQDGFVPVSSIGLDLVFLVLWDLLCTSFALATRLKGRPSRGLCPTLWAGLPERRPCQDLQTTLGETSIGPQAAPAVAPAHGPWKAGTAALSLPRIP